MTSRTPHCLQPEPMIGVGLRHPHYADALSQKAPVDFIEVHSENFYADGGALHALISQASEMYPISLHSTALGLGSAQQVPEQQLKRLSQLTELTKPILLSDHASFSWSSWQQQVVHAGDLLPLRFSEDNLAALAANVDQVQQFLGRQFLVENLSAYIQFNDSIMSETEFLTRLTDKTQCGLLIDLNNILVTALNHGKTDPLEWSKQWLKEIPAHRVAEIHLAGYTPVADGQLIVDDHSQPVSEQCWELYDFALQLFGNVPTLIEWDNQIPSWQTLLDEAKKARAIADSYTATLRRTAL